MLTRDLLEFRARKGKVTPKRLSLDGDDATLAEVLAARVAGAVCEARGALEADLTALANGHARPRVAKGLVKLLLDRATFEEPDPAAEARREQWLRAAEAARRALPAGATFDEYEAVLHEQTDVSLDALRDALYGDLPHRRRLVEVDPLSGPELVHRYNLAQVQGLLLHAARLQLDVRDGDTPELRRVLRWMRFNRLVAEVEVDDGGWQLGIEGPAAVLDGAKRYGLQLATFFIAVPTLPRWSVTAQLKLPRRPPLTLEIDEQSGLRPGLSGGAGHVPDEMRKVLDKWADPDWRLDPNPAPRPVGVHGWCMPDFSAHRGDVAVAVELFHPWHRGALAGRLEALTLRPQPDLLLGVDRKLVDKLDVDPESPQLFVFSAFPSKRGLERALKRWWAAYGAG